MKPPEAAELKHRVTIRQMTDTRGADGSVVQTASTYAYARARIIPLRGSEDFIAQGVSASVVFDVWLRYVSGVTPKMELLWGTRTLTIDSVRNIDERGRWLSLVCTENV